MFSAGKQRCVSSTFTGPSTAKIDATAVGVTIGVSLLRAGHSSALSGNRLISESNSAVPMAELEQLFLLFGGSVFQWQAEGDLREYFERQSLHGVVEAAP